MKMAYERPMMAAELYMTNAYCGVCGTVPYLKDTITTSGNISDYFNPRNNSNVSAVSGYDYSHTFTTGAAEPFTSQATGYEGATQYYWVCTCSECEGQRYLLEYSAEWANEVNENTFILYKDTAANEVLNVNWRIWSFPDNNYSSNEDRALGATLITLNGETVVVASN